MSFSKRFLIATMVIVVVGASLFPAPAWAGGLTSISVGTENPYTSATNTTYDWSFATTSTNTLAFTATTVPSGTDCPNHYFLGTGTSGNRGYTPDSVANSITGDLDIRAKILPTSWTPAGKTALIAKVNTKTSYGLYLTSTGSPEFDWSADGTTVNAVVSPSVPTTSPTQPLWIRATLQVNNGNSGNTVTFLTSPDGSTWYQLGSPQISAGVTSIYDSTDQLEVGATAAGTANLLSGELYAASVRSGINGTLKASFDANSNTVPVHAGWNATTGETWTVATSGASIYLQANIACDLTPVSITGVPTGGTARILLYQNTATYTFTPTAIASGSAIVLKLGGFINTATAGSYSSSITTYDTSSPPVAKDSGTGNYLSLFSTSTANLTGGSLKLSSQAAADTNVAYKFTANNVSLSVVKCIKINVSNTNDHSGIKPVGFSGASAAIDATSTWTNGSASWTVTNDDVSGTVTLTNTTGYTPVSSSGQVLQLDGLTNSSTSGTFYATINTYGNTNCNSTQLDNMTVSSGLGTTGNVIVTGTIDPTLTFSVANQATACNGESNFSAAAGSSIAVSLGHLVASSNVSGGEALSVASNAAGGFTVYLRGSQSTQNLRNAGHNWVDVSGTYTSPAALGSGEVFGYTYKDSTGSTSVTNPGSSMFSALDSTNRSVMGSSSSTNGSACVSFDAQTSASTPAGSYSAVVIYTAVPVF